eukprot:6141959-Pyramimonas_sp.AAC.1
MSSPTAPRLLLWPQTCALFPGSGDSGGVQPASRHPESVSRSSSVRVPFLRLGSAQDPPLDWISTKSELTITRLSA